MKPASFSYSAPASVEEALSLLAEHGSEAKLLAGGQSLVPLLSFRLARPAHLIDLNGLGELSSISTNGVLTLGSMTRMTAVEESGDVSSSHPILPMAMAHVGHRAIRNRGTVGGSLAHNDPSAELPALMLALNAEVTARSSSDERVISASDLLGDRFFETALEPDEMLTEIRIPASGDSSGSGFHEFSRRHGDFAVAGVGAVVTMEGSTIQSAALAAFGGTHPIRLSAAEAALEGANADEAAYAAAGTAAAGEFPTTSDIHGSAEYRQHLVGVLTARALADAVNNAGGGNG